MTVSLAALIIEETKETLYATGLRIATLVGVPVSSWRAGDPTRSLYHLESEVLSVLEKVVAGFIRSGFRDYATGDWLVINAKQTYNVDVPDASYASTTVVLTNTKGGDFTFEPGDVVVQNSSTKKTFTSKSGGHLGPAGGGSDTLSIDIVADEPGSASSSAAGEIDTLVTTFLGVTVTNATAAIGQDVQEESVTREQCTDKLESLSPDGPKGAYAFVARSPDLTGTNTIPRVRAYPDSDTGDVTIYLADASGGVTTTDRDLIEAAIVKWATPLCVTPTVLAATNHTVAVTYELWIYKSINKTSSEIEDDVEAALEQLFANAKIGGDIIPPAATGDFYKSLIESTIRGVYDGDANVGFASRPFRVSVTLPVSDVSLTNAEVPVLGAVTPTIHLVNDP